jgi:hypothetical protein
MRAAIVDTGPLASRLNAQLKIHASVCRNGRAFDPCGLPQPLSGVKRIDIELLPPFEFIAALVELAMVRATQRTVNSSLTLRPNARCWANLR